MDDETKGLIRHRHSDEGVLDDKPLTYGSQSAVVNDRTDESVIRDRKVQYRKLPLGIWFLETTGLLNFKPLISHKALVLILTFMCYTSYHLSRKPTSVIKVAQKVYTHSLAQLFFWEWLTIASGCALALVEWVVFCPICANCTVPNVSNWTNETAPGWAPFNNKVNGDTLLGALDNAWLFAYAISMFVSGQIADRVNLRYFLTIGMLGSGISVCLLGVTYYAKIHMLWYFIVVQIFGGVMQSTGWPGVVAVMSHWFGKHNRGLIMGVWNSHTSVGNILGTIIPSFWAKCNGVDDSWGWSFFVPGFIIFGLGIVMFFMLVVDPKHVGLPPPRHSLDDPAATTPPVSPSSGTYGRLRPDEGDVADEEDEKKMARLRETERLHNEPAAHTIQTSTDRGTDHPKPKSKSKAVNILRAFLIPGVIEFSLALFFDKLVSYTFLYWLPFYVKNKLTNLSAPQSDWLSTLFDVGGIIGGILAGVISDQLRARALTCVVMLILAIPSLYVLDAYADASLGLFIVMLILCGIFVNGPYGMITTAVSSDLGTHKSLKNNQNAKATVTAIIDGTGSMGAAIGPLVIGWVTNEWDWMVAFYVLMGSCALSALLLTRLVIRDIRGIFLWCSSTHRRRWHSRDPSRAPSPDKDSIQ